MNLTDGLKETLSGIGGIFSDILTQLTNLNNLLTTKINEMDTLITQISNNDVTGGLAWIDFIATFHYVVGDVIYYLFFAFILFGLSITIFQIVMLIKNNIPLGGIISKIKGLIFS